MSKGLAVRSSIAVGLVAMASGATAATLDFTIPTSGFTVDTYTAVGGSNPAGALTGNLLTGEAGFASIQLDVDGINLDIYIDDPWDGNPYFDADSGGPGGLGSCRNLTSSAQCTPTNDDNLTISANESLRMDFALDSGAGTQAIFGDFGFYDDNHNAITGTIRVTHDGGMSTINVVGGVGSLAGIGSSSFLLFNDQADATQASTNYYISSAVMSAVPVPAAVWLFGSALGALGWIRRRKTR